MLTPERLTQAERQGAPAMFDEHLEHVEHVPIYKPNSSSLKMLNRTKALKALMDEHLGQGAQGAQDAHGEHVSIFIKQDARGSQVAGYFGKEVEKP